MLPTAKGRTINRSFNSLMLEKGRPWDHAKVLSRMVSKSLKHTSHEIDMRQSYEIPKSAQVNREILQRTQRMSESQQLTRTGAPIHAYTHRETNIHGHTRPHIRLPTHTHTQSERGYKRMKVRSAAVLELSIPRTYDIHHQIRKI